MWRTRSLLQFPDRTNGSLSLSFYLFLVAIVYLFFLSIFSPFFFTRCVNYFRLFFFHVAWERGEGEGERGEGEGEREKGLNLGMAVFPGRWQWENWSIERVPTEYSMQFSSRVFSFLLSFFVCVCVCTRCS